MNKDVKCIIIGAGASGLMLAANLKVSKGTLLEKTGNIGTKLLMSGGGRCNVTHAGFIKDFISCYGDSGPRIRKCLYKYSNTHLMEWLQKNGLILTNENDRIFPASFKASDVLNLLRKKAESNGWEIKTNTEVSSLSYSDNLWIVDSRDRAPNLIIATGGITYPDTGSDGSMFEVLKSLGIVIKEPRSALAAINVENYPFTDLSGITLKSIKAEISKPGFKTVRMTGDLLFTHRNFSGPVILNISRYAEPGAHLTLRYERELSGLPKRMQQLLKERATGPSGDIRRKTLEKLLAADVFTIASVDPNGMVTAGGISLDEIDTSSMQIKKHPGLFAIGEAIDAEGITGGYNLQMCWSTAAAAAEYLGSIL